MSTQPPAQPQEKSDSSQHASYFEGVTYVPNKQGKPINNESLVYQKLLSKNESTWHRDEDEDQERWTMKQQIALGLMLLIAVILTLLLGSYISALKTAAAASHSKEFDHGPNPQSYYHHLDTRHQQHDVYAGGEEGKLRLLCKCILVRHATRRRPGYIPQRTTFKILLHGHTMDELHKKCNMECVKMKKDLIESDRELRRQVHHENPPKIREFHSASTNEAFKYLDSFSNQQLQQQHSGHGLKIRGRNKLDEFWISHRSIIVPLILGEMNALNNHPHPHYYFSRNTNHLKVPTKRPTLLKPMATPTEPAHIKSAPSRPSTTLPAHLAPFIQGSM
jgi:hypothetical protein